MRQYRTAIKTKRIDLIKIVYRKVGKNRTTKQKSHI